MAARAAVKNKGDVSQSLSKTSSKSRVFHHAQSRSVMSQSTSQNKLNNNSVEKKEPSVESSGEFDFGFEKQIQLGMLNRGLAVTLNKKLA